MSTLLTRTPFHFPKNCFQVSIKIYQWKKQNQNGAKSNGVLLS